MCRMFYMGYLLGIYAVGYKCLGYKKDLSEDRDLDINSM